jgi:hypothetical protein
VIRSTQLAVLVGSTALIGAGVAPFLHREAAPDRWFEVHWPHEVKLDDVSELLRHLASSRRPPVLTLELRADHGRLSHMVGVAAGDTERLGHLFSTYLPDALLEPVERAQLTLTRAVSVRLGTRERALRTDNPEEVARSLAVAVAGAHRTTVVQLQLGSRLAPSHVAHDSVGLPSTGRMLGQSVRYGLKPLDVKARADLQSKVGDHGFRVTLRIATDEVDSNAARRVLRSVIDGLRVAEAPGVPIRVRRTDPDGVVRAVPPRRSGMALNVGELVGLLGWPLGDRSYPSVQRMTSRRLAVPAAVGERGRVVGDGDHPSTRRPVAQSTHDSLMHTHVLGPTGVGKSTLLAQLALQDIEAGRGVVVIEPKGDLIAEILARFPKERESDVVVLDPADALAPVGLNPLARGSPELVTDQVLAVFRGIYGDYLGPRTTDVLQAALLTLARSKLATLIALPLLLTDDRLRRSLTVSVRDDLALGPFWAWYDGLSDAERQQVIAPVMNKVRPFLLRERIRHVLGQAQPRFTVRQVFTERKILLVPLSKGTLGGEASGLLGSLVVAQLWQAAQSRAQIAPERRHPVSVLIDEFQDFLHLPTDLADVLAQARGLGLGLTLAHQHLGQMSPSMRAAVLANARSRVCFRLSAEDASVIARTTNEVDARDFQELGRYEVYASLLADSAVQPYCSAITRPLQPASSDETAIRQLSRMTFGVESRVIEAEIAELWRPTTKPEHDTIGSRRRQPKTEPTEGDER